MLRARCAASHTQDTDIWIRHRRLVFQLYCSGWTDKGARFEKAKIFSWSFSSGLPAPISQAIECGATSAAEAITWKLALRLLCRLTSDAHIYGSDILCNSFAENHPCLLRPACRAEIIQFCPIEHILLFTASIPPNRRIVNQKKYSGHFSRDGVKKSY